MRDPYDFDIESPFFQESFRERRDKTGFLVLLRGGMRFCDAVDEIGKSGLPPAEKKVSP